MLQQTPVNRVIPHLEAWLERWPTPADLAADPPAEAVRQWANLGYPRRALWLHRAAVEIRDRHGGVVPARRRRAPRPDRHRRLHRARRRGLRVRRPASRRRHEHPARARPRGRRPVAARPAVAAATSTTMDAILPADDRAMPRSSTPRRWSSGATVCTARAPRCDACPIARPLRLARGRLSRHRRRRAAVRRATRAATARRAGAVLRTLRDAAAHAGARSTEVARRLARRRASATARSTRSSPTAWPRHPTGMLHLPR